MKQKPSFLERIRRAKPDKKGKEETPKRNYLNYRICPYCKGSGIDSSSSTSTITGQPQNCTICGGCGRIPL